MIVQDVSIIDYKNTISKLHAPEELRSTILNLPDKRNKPSMSGWIRAAIIAAAVVFSFVISNFITWAANGTPWVVTVSDSLFNEQLEKMSEHYPSLQEDSFTYTQNTTEADPTVAKHEENLNIDDLSNEQLDALWDNYQNSYQQELRQSCDYAVAHGYVYLFEKVLEYNEEWGLPLHDYNYIKAFTPEELEGAQFSDDYEWIKIQGENYHVMVSHVGDFNELDDEMPDLKWETRILRVFTEENYNKFAEIMTIEGLESIKKNLAIPIYEGRVAAYSNEDDSLIRTFSEEECHNAEISENSQVVKIAGELYMVTYKIDFDTHSTIEIRLKSPDGYRGDAKTEGIDQYKFYTMADFNIGN